MTRAELSGVRLAANGRRVMLAFVHDEGAVVSQALGLSPVDTEQFLHRGLTLRPEHRTG